MSNREFFLQFPIISSYLSCLGRGGSENMYSLRFIFRVGCVLIAFTATLYPIYLFNLDEDSVQIKFKDTYSDKNRIYPAMTLCFDRTTFHKFNQSSEDKLGVDMAHQTFSNQSTLDIEDYINNIVIKDMTNNQTRFTRSGTHVLSDVAIKDKSLSINTLLRRYRSTNCFAIGIPFLNKKGINSMNVGIRKSIFNLGTIPTRNELIHGKSQLNIGLSYQNQHFPLISRDGAHLKAFDAMNNTCSGLTFKVRGMEIVSHRNKPTDPCIDYGIHDFTMVLNDAAIAVGCMPQGWEIVTTLAGCQNNKLSWASKKLFDASLYNANANQSTRPCRSIVDLWYEQLDETIDLCTDDPSTLHLTVVYNNLRFKEMEFIRKYTIWDLLSSISVILGLFLGISFLQLPDMLVALKRRKEKKHCNTYEVRHLGELLPMLLREIKNNKRRIALLEHPKPLQRHRSAIFV